MAFSFRTFSKRFFIISNVVTALAFLLACLQPWLHPETFWLISFLSLTLPYLLLMLLGFLVFWFFFKIRYTLISIIALLIGWKQVNVLAGFNSESFSKKINKEVPTLRVLSWNVRAMKGIGNLSEKEMKPNLAKIFAMIKSYRSDVVCFQEFGIFDYPHAGFDHIQSMKKLGYPYYVLSKDYSRVAWKYTSGVAIFSKHPIVFKKRVQFSSSPESVLMADIAWESDTVRVFTSHLQSFKLLNEDFAEFETTDRHGKKLVEASSNLFSKMKRAFRNRGVQADQIRELMDSCQRPAIFCGDLNDVPGSYTYWKLRGDTWQDAFLKKGFGIGRTYMSLAPTLRIDYVLAGPGWEVEQFATIPGGLSDHLPVVADLVQH
ncbi:MAG TPA: endonuclease/exonuclease/phosphatase family protein [Phnomibacter sp.]|nr:endonuclease/exonuclease/phosphatase family protein [Phnomibacter sp.]